MLLPMRMRYIISDGQNRCYMATCIRNTLNGKELEDLPIQRLRTSFFLLRNMDNNLAPSMPRS